MCIRDSDWVSERVEEFGTRVTRWTPVDTEVGRQSVTTDENGQATVSFTPEEGGTYLIVATVTDGGGREQFSSTALWSVDAQFAGWRSDPNVRTMDLTLDKSEYQPGETAQILVQSPFAQPVQAWLVVERGNIIDQKVITIEGSEIVSLPITAEYAPNVLSLIHICNRHRAPTRRGVARPAVAPIAERRPSPVSAGVDRRRRSCYSRSER